MTLPDGKVTPVAMFPPSMLSADTFGISISAHTKIGCNRGLRDLRKNGFPGPAVALDWPNNGRNVQCRLEGHPRIYQIICFARTLRELKCSSYPNDSHQPLPPVNFISCRHTQGYGVDGMYMYR